MTPIPLTDTSRPPQFPCWVWSDIFKAWSIVAYIDTVHAMRCTHWHPDQPEAPTERPEEVDTTLADELRAECNNLTPEQRQRAHEHGMKMINQSSDNRQAESANRQSDTPRTDEEIGNRPFECPISITFARTLERELSALNEQLQARVLDLADMTQQRDKIVGEFCELEEQLHALRLVCGTTDANKFETALDRALAKNRALEQELAATKALLEAQLKFQRELRADRDRLDWLTENLGAVMVGDDCDPTDHIAEGEGWPKAWRAAIDAAMGVAKQEDGV